MGGDAPTVPKRKKSKNVDSRLKISGMTEKYYKGATPPYKPPEKTKTQKDKGKRQKITRRKKTSVSSFLNVSIRNLNYLKTRTFGFPIEDFGNDG